MATEKIANYTAEMTAELTAAYVAEPTEVTVKAFAEKFGKNAKSIVAKLVKEGVYVSKAKEAGKRAMLKAEMVAEIAKLVGKPEEVLESLEKATSPALMAVLTALRANETVDTDSGQAPGNE
jgi:putative heme iron utilization protein